MIFNKNELDNFTLREKVQVQTEKGNLLISAPALQVAYKKYVLGSNKDLEDARHLQTK